MAGQPFAMDRLPLEAVAASGMVANLLPQRAICGQPSEAVAVIVTSNGLDQLGHGHFPGMREARGTALAHRRAAGGVHVLCRARQSQRPHGVAEVHEVNERL